MGADELKQALDDCIINFDAQVLVTNLLQDYQMAYADVDKILKQHIADEEKKGTKFEKRFLVSGEDEATKNEIYAVIDSEKQLKEWLCKLKNAESALYSVEVAGGAKPAADIFVPMRWCPIQLDNVKTRAPLSNSASATTKASSSSSANVKTEVKQEPKKPKGFDFSANAKKSTTINDTKIPEKDAKTSPTPTEQQKTPKKRNSPEEQKSTAATAKGNAKKGIANFFGPAKTEDKSKKATGVIKPPTPKKMQDFFKKADKAAPSPKAKKQEKSVNKSVQLFDNEDYESENNDDEVEEIERKEVVVDVETSEDEEAQLETLRQKCNEENEISFSSSKKRRRIIDSDDDDDDDAGAPQVKHEKKEIESEENAAEADDAAKSETFLDDDGFVITIKAKKTVVKKPAKSPTPKKTSPPSKEDDKMATKTTPKTAAKSKQGNIMSFFSKQGYK